MKKELRVLVGCEFSGTVRRAFAMRGHDAWSCDLLPAEDRSNKHIVGDIRDILDDGWDLLIVAHPPCTRLCNSGVRWLSKPPAGKTLEQMWQELDEGCALFSDCWNAPIERVAVENPVMHKYAKERIRNYVEPAQSVQPWQFGHGEVKRTCFWLKNLPALTPTNIVDGREPRIHHMSPGPDRAKERSRFFSGIAEAMADQWGGYALEQAA
ncbi:MAG: putative DNA (cytosine-5)-methyltransferase [Prokaryotic dsDNA virus sp.]|nr:MAG: putative DNA (cytosine-5)-methyltransferase [Prokaryotic dsDNA virus sp.]|tara:strand:- start:18580 stop:19209 length:630 start_codon:yes stop_codon:yes gene_type:complete